MSVRWEVCWLQDPVHVPFFHNAQFSVYSVSFLIFNDIPYHKVLKVIAIERMREIKFSWDDELTICIFLCFNRGKGPIFNEYRLRLESVDKLFAKLDGVCLVVHASVDDNTLPLRLILQNDYLVLVVEVNAVLVRWQFDAHQLASLVSDFLTRHFLENV